ncbi:MAG: hypothetical protein M3P96_11800 [Actinomycetota bacterium]|nr:hypothetical protein [Actinomycetota bacterium]
MSGGSKPPLDLRGQGHRPATPDELEHVAVHLLAHQQLRDQPAVREHPFAYVLGGPVGRKGELDDPEPLGAIEQGHPQPSLARLAAVAAQQLERTEGAPAQRALDAELAAVGGVRRRHRHQDRLPVVREVEDDLLRPQRTGVPGDEIGKVAGGTEVGGVDEPAQLVRYSVDHLAPSRAERSGRSSRDRR